MMREMIGSVLLLSTAAFGQGNCDGGPDGHIYSWENYPANVHGKTSSAVEHLREIIDPYSNESQEIASYEVSAFLNLPYSCTLYSAGFAATHSGGVHFDLKLEERDIGSYQASGMGPIGLPINYRWSFDGLVANGSCDMHVTIRKSRSEAGTLVGEVSRLPSSGGAPTAFYSGPGAMVPNIAVSYFKCTLK